MDINSCFHGYKWWVWLFIFELISLGFYCLFQWWDIIRVAKKVFQLCFNRWIWQWFNIIWCHLLIYFLKVHQLFMHVFYFHFLPLLLYVFLLLYHWIHLHFLMNRIVFPFIFHNSRFSLKLVTVHYIQTNYYYYYITVLDNIFPR